ncbi:hypothetical protein K435DRAFT_812778 [Dendrothele bispora CBS 962.96]|uniref:Uncharacterized protein n=1 Tax=Dendrothele bispora (strain CBS 962.96) TaxID=1314807 RepID=A0A4S8KP56_DENBC|nr:hypothetical protein K435DRAFT_812778 [Dendrothele bispora CBS 962.96]
MEGGRKMIEVGVKKAMENMNLELGTEGLERMERMEKALEEIKEKLEVGEVRQTTWADEVDNVIQGARTESYVRVVVQQVIKPRHDEALHAAKARDRHLLLKTANQQLWQKTEAELTQLANKVLDTILDGSERVKIVGVNKLAGGQGLLMFRMTEEVKWLVENKMLDGMAAAMGENITIRPNVFEVVVEFVPVNVQIEMDGEREDITIDNGMKEGSLIAARWIKPVERRHSKQVVVHAMFQFADRESVNQAIREGIMIKGKQLNARKSEVDVVQRVEEKKARDPETRYKYFVTEDAGTWVLTSKSKGIGVAGWREAVRAQMEMGWNGRGTGRLVGATPGTGGGRQAPILGQVTASMAKPRGGRKKQTGVSSSQRMIEETWGGLSRAPSHLSSQ